MIYFFLITVHYGIEEQQGIHTSTKSTWLNMNTLIVLQVLAFGNVTFISVLYYCGCLCQSTSVFDKTDPRLILLYMMSHITLKKMSQSIKLYKSNMCGFIL